MSIKMIVDYRDMHGKITKNRLISEIKPIFSYEIVGFCHLRNAERTFNIGNIKKVINPSTNEIIKDIQLYVGIKDEAGNIKKEFQD